MQKSPIEWCETTWNPVTGCDNGCPYCYAKKIAHRYSGYQLNHELDGHHPPRHEPLDGEGNRDGFVVLDAPLKRFSGARGVTNAPFPYEFTPTFHRYRLDEPANKRNGQTIFVCSMADLFGKHIPTKWIVDVLDACVNAPKHRYLFLTKNPQRYVELDKLSLLPRMDNFWYGTTITHENEPLFVSENHHCFASIEPILEPFTHTENSKLSLLEWIIVGYETGGRPGKSNPKKKWAEPIAEFCKENQIPLLMKHSMKKHWGKDLIVQYPFKKEW